MEVDGRWYSFSIGWFLASSRYFSGGVFTKARLATRATFWWKTLAIWALLFRFGPMRWCDLHVIQIWACDHIHGREENWCLCHGHLSERWKSPCWVEGCEYYIVFDPWISKYSGYHHHTGNPMYLRVFQLRDVKTEWNSRGGYPLVKFNIAIKYPHVQEEIHLPTVDFPPAIMIL